MKQNESTMHSKIRRCLYINMKSARPLGRTNFTQTWTGSSNSEGARVGAQGLAAFHSSKAAKEWAMPRLCQAPGRSAQCEPASPAGRSCAPCAHPVLSQDLCQPALGSLLSARSRRRVPREGKPARQLVLPTMFASRDNATSLLHEKDGLSACVCTIKPTYLLWSSYVT